MPFGLQVIRASEFARFDAHEHLDLDASKDVLRSLGKACRKRGRGCALLDLRTLQVPEKLLFTANDLAGWSARSPNASRLRKRVCLERKNQKRKD